MLDVFWHFLLGFIVALSGALIPGPLLVFTIDYTMKYGKRHAGILTALGHCTVEVGILLVIILGLTVIFESVLFQYFVNVVGGLFFVFFGAMTILGLRRRKARTGYFRANHNAFVGGIIFTVFNATIPLWWATVGLQMLNQALRNTTIVGVLFWVLGHWSADISWFGFVGYSVYKGKNYIKRDTHNYIILACGMLMIFLGAYFLGTSVLNLH